MCQAKPGPRCSDHARKQLAQATKAYEEAEQRGWRSWDERDQMARTVREARNDWESTPAGQKELKAKLKAAEADGSTNQWEASEFQRRIDEGKQRREKQKRELAIAVRGRERLASAPPAEAAAITHAEQRLERAKEVTADAQAVYDRANREYNEKARASSEATQEYAKTQDRVTVARDGVRDAQRDVASEASRLYSEHGCKFGGHYARDMMDEANGTPGSWVSQKREMEAIKRRVEPAAMRMKVKRNGPDAAGSAAAAKAAETDEKYQAAVAKETAARENLSAVIRDKTDSERSRVASNIAREEMYQAASARNNAERTLEAAHRDLSAAEADARHQRARVAAGCAEGQNVSWGSANQIMRNPDGTTNAYVYQPPRDGFPDGVYLRGTGVKTVHGMGPGNSLVLENGENVHRAESYSRPAGHRVYGPSEIRLTEPQPGATPLWQETGHQGWGTFIDSTD